MTKKGTFLERREAKLLVYRDIFRTCGPQNIPIGLKGHKYTIDKMPQNIICIFTIINNTIFTENVIL